MSTLRLWIIIRRSKSRNSGKENVLYNDLKVHSGQIEGKFAALFDAAYFRCRSLRPAS